MDKFIDTYLRILNEEVKEQEEEQFDECGDSGAVENNQFDECGDGDGGGAEKDTQLDEDEEEEAEDEKDNDSDIEEDDITTVEDEEEDESGNEANFDEKLNRLFKEAQDQKCLDASLANEYKKKFAEIDFLVDYLGAGQITNVTSTVLPNMSGNRKFILNVVLSNGKKLTISPVGNGLSYFAG